VSEIFVVFAGKLNIIKAYFLSSEKNLNTFKEGSK